MIQKHISTANATYPDGETKPLTVPSEVTKVFLKTHIRMENENSITVLIDLQTVDLKAIVISHSLNLRPVIEAAVKGDRPTRPLLFFSQPKQISI